MGPSLADSQRTILHAVSAGQEQGLSSSDNSLGTSATPPATTPPPSQLWLFAREPDHTGPIHLAMLEVDVGTEGRSSFQRCSQVPEYRLVPPWPLFSKPFMASLMEP